MRRLQEEALEGFGAVAVEEELAMGAGRVSAQGKAERGGGTMGDTPFQIHCAHAIGGLIISARKRVSEEVAGGRDGEGEDVVVRCEGIDFEGGDRRTGEQERE